MAWIDGGDLIVARAPDFMPETRLARSEAGAVTRLYMSEDGRSIFYLRERSEPSQSKELLLLNANGDAGAGQVIAAGAQVPSAERVVVAPNGQALAFVEGMTLFELRRAADGRWARRRLIDQSDPRLRAAVGYDDVEYSPDGRHVAFISERKAGQSYVAVHDTLGNGTEFIAPSVFADIAPVWSPDGTQLAFIRQPNNSTQDYRFSPERGREGGVPWSILVANIKTGVVRTIWQADPGSGSIRSSGGELIWAASGEIIFAWEKTGWNLLYAVPASGGTPRLLTPGTAEVSGFGLSADGHTVVYGANFGDVMHDHLWRVSLEGGAPVQLTSGAGMESLGGRPVGFTVTGHLSYIDYLSAGVEVKGQGQGQGKGKGKGSHRYSPPQVIIRDSRGKTRPLRSQPDHVVQRNQAVWDRFLPIQTVSVRAEDGVTGHHVVIAPGTPPPQGGYPVIVHAHGGPVEKATPMAGSSSSLFGQYAARRGYLFIDINYRGSRGFGLDFRLPDGRGATGGSELKDLVALVDYLKSRADVNTKRVGIMGGSYGGHLVGLAMSRLPDDFAAGVSLFGVADWVVEMKKDMEVASGGMRDPLYYIRLSERVRIEDLAHASSSTSQVENWRGPTLLTIGDLDNNGHLEAVQDLGYRLLKRGVPVEFYVDPAGGHDVFPQEKVFEFFERTLAR